MLVMICLGCGELMQKTVALLNGINIFETNMPQNLSRFDKTY